MKIYEQKEKIKEDRSTGKEDLEGYIIERCRNLIEVIINEYY
jgi:hypothetical protein